MSNTITKNSTKSMLNTETKYIFQALSDRIFTSKIHTHTFYEFVCVLKGTCTHYCDDSTCELNEGDFILLSPGNRHCFLSQSDDSSLLCISIAKDEFQKYKLLYGDTLTTNTTIPVHLDISVFDVLSKLVSDLANPTQNEIRAVCSAFFASYCDAVDTGIPVPTILLHMTEEMLNNTKFLQLGIKAMMFLTNYSEAQLGRLTKKYYSLSPHAYLKQIRMQKAWHYILQSDLSLEEISFLCGYNCYGYFTNIFKEKYGLSPAMLRKTGHCAGYATKKEPR